MYPYEEAYMNYWTLQYRPYNTDFSGPYWTLQYRLYYNYCNLLAEIMSHSYLQNNAPNLGCPLQIGWNPV